MGCLDNNVLVSKYSLVPFSSSPFRLEYRLLKEEIRFHYMYNYYIYAWKDHPIWIIYNACPQLNLIPDLIL